MQFSKITPLKHALSSEVPKCAISAKPNKQIGLSRVQNLLKKMVSCIILQLAFGISIYELPRIKRWLMSEH